MFCPAGVNTGLIQLAGAIASNDVKSITVDRAPLTIKFDPRSTPANLHGNRINEPVTNTCTYGMSKFSLDDVQLSAPVHTGYNLPGNTDTPRGELILSFSALSAPSSNSQVSGILLCLPIYVSSSTSHNLYLDQLVEQDPTAANIASLESLFYSSDTTQTSFGYVTCFETQDEEGNVGSNSLFVNVYPNGIHLAAGIYQSLFAMLGQTLDSYQLPPGLRGGDAIVRNTTIDKDGNRVVTQVDKMGGLYTTLLSSCSEEFTQRFEYFTVPPQRISSQSSKVTAVGGTCPTVQQYKCIPFEQLRDNQGGYVQLKDGTCLDDIIKKGGTPPTPSDDASAERVSSSLSVAEIEEIAGGVIVGALGIIAILWFLNNIKNN